MSKRPLPVPDEMSAPYWAAAARHVLALPRCSQCQEFTMPPDSTCPHSAPHFGGGAIVYTNDP